MSGLLRAEPFGAVAATDTDGNGRVDTPVALISIDVSDRVQAGEPLVAGFLYWAGSHAQQVMACDGSFDDTIELTLPSESPETVQADICYCADGGSIAYDMYACRLDITERLGQQVLTGAYQISGFDALISDGATDNASVSLVLIVNDNSSRQVTLLDGLETIVNATVTLQTSGNSIASSEMGRFSFHVLDGDIGGLETLTVNSSAGTPQALGDADNPTDNLMNHTINLASPAVIDSIGLDLDRFQIPPNALVATDQQVSVSITAGTDKWWPVWILWEWSTPSEVVFFDGFE
jgi:hypothetical protein